MKKAVSIYFAGALSLVFSLESAAFNSKAFQEPSSESSAEGRATTAVNTANLKDQEISHETLIGEQGSSGLADNELQNGRADKDQLQHQRAC